MTTIITGGRGTGSILQTRREIDVADKIYLLQPDAAPLTVILMRAKKSVCINPKFYVFEDDLIPRQDTINCGAGYLAGDGDLVVDNISYFAVGDVVKVEASGEVLLVTAVTTGTSTISVDRAWGETSAAAIADGAYLLIMGNASEEGADTPTVKSTKVEEVFNYCGICRKSIELTRTEMNSELLGGNDLTHQRAKALLEHRVDIERKILFSERKLDTSGTHYKRSTRGLIKHISTNVTTDAALTETDFETFLESGFQYGSSTKVLFASAKIVSAINYWAKGSLQIPNKSTTYGIAVMQYLSAHGVVNVIRHRLLSGTTYGGYAILCDMNNLAYRYLKDSDTKLIRNVQSPGADKVTDEYLTECGLELRNEKTFAVLKGVTSYS